MDPVAATYAFVDAFVDELAHAGVEHAVVCPGSRSTPLALTLARHPHIRLWMHLDERSAAFFALGLAKGTGVPVALVCTSGTAAANFMPAIVEARQARVPLLALTADRPPELRDCGAPQTIDQIRFYGAQVKWAVEMPVPEGGETMLRFARTTAARAAATAAESPSGPIHLNFPFREPLVPPAGTPLPDGARGDRGGRRPCVRVRAVGAAPAPSEVERLATQLAGAPRGLIVCGSLEDEPGATAPIAALGRALGYPILADPLSGLRCGPHDRALVVDAHDAFLREPRFVAAAAPQVILRFGAMPTSKPVLQYLQRHPDACHILVDRAGWRDPTLLAAEMLRAGAGPLCEALLAACAQAPDAEWTALWREANRRARVAIEEVLSQIEEPFEGRAMAELAGLLPDGATLFAGNSMPVRDIDSFFHGDERRIRILGNRGASGIDGVTSTALGVAASGGPVVLAIGDVSLYHDLNGLLAAALHGISLTVVLLNNDGGGIFSFLPQADLPADDRGDPFEALFGTPHGLDFAHAAALYGATFSRVASWVEYRRAVARGVEGDGLHIVELRTERARNVALHRRVWPAVSAAIADLLP